jgi:xanthine dehydrogenase small subunit
LIKFILNEKEISTDLPSGFLLLDFVRYQKQLIGTKIGCREGDCGACTVLVGDIVNGQLEYRSMTSCLLPLGNVQFKHVVTVEGTNLEKLNPIQQYMSDEGATQCGFCTPGFIVSLSGFCLSSEPPTYENAIAAIDGNICRCTGYKSIERATANVVKLMQQKKEGENQIDFVTEHHILPAYFNEIKNRLEILKNNISEVLPKSTHPKFLGGGTDLYVQQHDTMVHTDIDFLLDNSILKGVRVNGDICCIGSAATVTDILQSDIFQKYFPKISQHIKLVSSTPIRNMATIAGNFVNASPIGDLSIFFLALDAQLNITYGITKRKISLRKFYKGYKDLDKLSEEYIESIEFKLPTKNSFFNFEKVSKRTHLDIASVNTACSLEINNGFIESASLSAGGVGPVPMYLSNASSYLVGKELSAETFSSAIKIATEEISPMSDARGTKEYKSLLLQQLIKAHFISLFPELNFEKLMID